MIPDNFGIYVHWPFCAAKCPYCDFNSHVRAELDEAAWRDAIARELDYTARNLVSSRAQVSSVFFGGGTPSLVSGTAVGAVLDGIAKLWPVAEDVEITLEANPSSVDAARFRDYRSAGVNRLSVGVQSLRNDALVFLGRRHNAAEAKAAMLTADSIFEHVSLDLIYSRPGQTIEDWRAELHEAIALGTEHLSLYQLTIEEATPFAAMARTGALLPNGDERAANLYEVTQEITESSGLPQYEISNHARPGRECRHNLLYWRYGSFVGTGPGAHGRIATADGPLATTCERLPERWVAQVATTGHGYSALTCVSNEDAAREHLLMSLRLAEGLNLEDYCARWNIGFDDTVVKNFEREGFVARRRNRLVVSPAGRLVLNAIVAALVDASRPIKTRESEMSVARG